MRVTKKLYLGYILVQKKSTIVELNFFFPLIIQRKPEKQRRRTSHPSSHSTRTFWVTPGKSWTIDIEHVEKQPRHLKLSNGLLSLRGERKVVLPCSLTCCKKLTASIISKESSLIFIDGNASTAHKTCMRLPSNKTPNSFFHRKLTKLPATQSTLYSLPLLLCNFFNREIHNGGSRAARVHGISQR